MKRLAVLCALLFWLPLAGAAEAFGTVDALSGSASVTGQDGQSAPVSAGMRIYAGDTISSAHDGEVQIVTEDGGLVALRPDTVFRVDQYHAQGDADDRTFMSLLKGAMRSVTGWIGKHNNAAYRVTTPTATVGIRGTDHEVAVVEQSDGDAPGTYDTVNEGSTVLKTAQGEVVTTPGQYAFAPRGRAVAPYFLAGRPHFLAMRRLRLEGRIPERRDYLRGHLEQMREERIRNFRQIRGQRPGGAPMQARSGAMERRAELGGLRRETRDRETRGQFRAEPRNGLREGRLAGRERRGEALHRGEGVGGGPHFGRRARRERE